MTRTPFPTSGSDTPLRSAAKGLGAFSIALGVTELLAPRMVARMTGVHGHDTLIRAYGLREIVNGIGLLTSNDPVLGLASFRSAARARPLCRS